MHGYHRTSSLSYSYWGEEMHFGRDSSGVTPSYSDVPIRPHPNPNPEALLEQWMTSREIGFRKTYLTRQTYTLIPAPSSNQFSLVQLSLSRKMETQELAWQRDENGSRAGSSTEVISSLLDFSTSWFLVLLGPRLSSPSTSWSQYLLVPVFLGPGIF